jgi:hypothetical protein
MMDVMARADRIEASCIELKGLYDLLRHAYLNVLYYGRRAASCSRLNFWLQLGAAIGSLGAVTGFLTSQTSVAGEYELGWRIASAVVGTLSGICAALPPLMGLTEKINKLERLHFAYCELQHLTQLAIADIRREGLITAEQIGGAKLLLDLHSRLGQQDEPGPQSELRDKCEKDVRDRYPSGSFWYPTVNGNEAADSSTAKTVTDSTRA